MIYCFTSGMFSVYRYPALGASAVETVKQELVAGLDGRNHTVDMSYFSDLDSTISVSLGLWLLLKLEAS